MERRPSRGLRACVGAPGGEVRPAARCAREEMHMYRRYGDITWEPADAPGASGGAAAAASPRSVGIVADRPRAAGGNGAHSTVLKRESRARAETLPGHTLPTVRIH